jgi:hypothetical protein
MRRPEQSNSPRKGFTFTSSEFSDRHIYVCYFPGMRASRLYPMSVTVIQAPSVETLIPGICPFGGM